MICQMNAQDCNTAVSIEKHPTLLAEMQTTPEAEDDDWRRGCTGLPGAGAHLRQPQSVFLACCTAPGVCCARNARSPYALIEDTSARPTAVTYNTCRHGPLDADQYLYIVGQRR